MGGGPCVVANGGAPQMYETSVLCDHPVAYWKLDQTATFEVPDASGHGHDATLVDGVTLGQPGIAGSDAVKFDGKTAELIAGDVLDFPATKSFTLEVWVKAAQLPLGSAGIVSKSIDGTRTGTGDEGYSISVDSAGELRADRVLHDATDSVVGGNVELGKFTHVIARYDGAYLALFQDGVQIANSASALQLVGNDAKLRAGSYGGCCRFAGVLDEVAIYDQALEDGQIAAHFAAGAR